MGQRGEAVPPHWETLGRKSAPGPGRPGALRGGSSNLSRSPAPGQEAVVDTSWARSSAVPWCLGVREVGHAGGSARRP